MQQSTIQQLVTAITPLAHKLGQGATELYKFYFKQTIINGVESVIISVLILTGLYFALRWIVKSTSSQNSGLGDDDRFGIRVIAFTVAATVAALVVFGSLITGINDLLNPGYATTQEIISQVTGK